jgi:hypothetical protein
LDFKTLGLEHIDLLRPFFLNNLCRICDCTIGGTFIWRDLFKTEFAIEDGVLYLKVQYLTGDIAYTPPRGVLSPPRGMQQDGAQQHGDTCPEKAAYDRIIDYCHDIGCQPRLCAVSEHRLERLREFYPEARASTDRAWSDYLYSSDDIKNLAGRKYSGQRNHINRFLRDYPSWVFEPIGGGNVGDVRAFFERYSKEHVKDYPAYDEGNIKTLEVLDNMEKYKLFGGALKVDGQIVGAALGEIIGDTLFVHIEKSLTEFGGSYPMLVNQFAKLYAVGDVQYINREEDDGVEGLRISKLSYHPACLLDKYVVELV